MVQFCMGIHKEASDVSFSFMSATPAPSPAHVAAKHDTYPETVAVMLWGLDAIKTRGESLAMALALVGARPEREGTGRIVRFELIPLEELGRPRIDILANLSGLRGRTFQTA